MNEIAILLSIFSTIVALISAYIAQFKKGKVKLLPIRAYRVEPLNFHVDGESYRAVRLILNLTMMNTGALSHAINDLRVRLNMDGKELILGWEEEYENLDAQQGIFASQPTLGPYESINKVYSFTNKREAEVGKMVSTMEEVCEKDKNKFYPAFIEMRKCGNKWATLYKMALSHSGRRNYEIDFEKINRF